MQQLHSDILIVEDSADVRETLTVILEAEGYTVASAANGQEALDYLRNAPLPRLVLLNLVMPVMNGWAFRAEQKLEPQLAAIPTVLISAHNNLAGQAASMNAAGYLAKPIDVQELLDLVARFCP